MIITAVNNVIYDFASSRTTPGVITIYKPHTGGETLLQLLHKIGWYVTIWRGKLKTELCILAD